MGTTAQPSTTPATGSLLNDMLDVFNVIHDPDGVFKRVSDRARILAPWVVLSVAVIIITILTRPYQQAAFDAFKSTLTPEQAAKMGNRGAGGGPLGLIFTPVVVLVMMAAGAGVFFRCSLLGGAGWGVIEGMGSGSPGEGTAGFVALYQRTASLVHRRACRLLGDRQAASDAQLRLLLDYSGAVSRYLLGALRDNEAADELAQEFAVRFIRGDFRGVSDVVLDARPAEQAVEDATQQ